ncbi:MAG TPA: aromatic amino acid lyase, partial [Ktedonobacteraceae bacterium]
QAFSASRTFYQALYHSVSAHPERSIVAANLRHLLEGSNHFELSTCNKSMQDPYSFRCIPQVVAAIRQTIDFARTTLENEANGVGDNPLFFPEDDQILFGGNLHGESTAFMLDFLAIALSELASISERRSYQLLAGQRGLPDFLAMHPGTNSGFMVAQYTAAALVNENKVLSTPASVDTISTSQLQEDHVSMGGTAAYKLCQIVENCEYVLAIELLIASQAVQLNQEVSPSPLTNTILQDFRQKIPFLEKDAILGNYIENSRLFLRQYRGLWRRELGLR